ncbi:MAG: UDP-N-acetylglucosamine diphosphorylase [[Eubacterium] sulci]|jgi:N-acetylglucosamine-1-phosphate uridyltransferase (contains nucleotidyltransferase and I-patch acetyltransferase domains)|nr:UDP-N-acetylglucosamine diphosphorylase [[Eubacterium] sulci]
MNMNEYKQRKDKWRKIAEKHIEAGVDIFDIDNVYIDEEVRIGEGTVIGPCVRLEGSTVIGKNCKIEQNSRIANATIGDDVSIDNSVILDSSVGSNTSVGPFAYIRPGSTIGEACKVGDFVEVKNASMGNGSKSAHLTYIGDADIGENVNLGCGVVFVNYDGKNKHRSTVGDGCFIGCNVNLVSPVDVGDGAYIAAGSTVTKDIPKDALSVGRARQKNIENWATQRGLYRK